MSFKEQLERIRNSQPAQKPPGEPEKRVLMGVDKLRYLEHRRRGGYLVEVLEYIAERNLLPILQTIAEVHKDQGPHILETIKIPEFPRDKAYVSKDKFYIALAVRWGEYQTESSRYSYSGGNGIGLILSSQREFLEEVELREEMDLTGDMELTVKAGRLQHWWPVLDKNFLILSTEYWTEDWTEKINLSQPDYKQKLEKSILSAIKTGKCKWEESFDKTAAYP